MIEARKRWSNFAMDAPSGPDPPLTFSSMEMESAVGRGWFKVSVLTSEEDRSLVEGSFTVPMERKAGESSAKRDILWKIED